MSTIMRCRQCDEDVEVFQHPGFLNPENYVCGRCLTTPLPDPGRNEIGKFQRPGDAAETQIQAAVTAYPSSGTWRRRVLDAIARAGRRGCTDEEIQNDLGLNPSTQRPRRVELVEGGWIVDSGRRRPTKSRRDAVVWVLSQNGTEQIEEQIPLL